MHGHALAQTIVSAGGPASLRALAACSVLVVLCGLLRPLEARWTARLSDEESGSEARRSSVRSDPPADAGADRAGASATGLNSIELALIAELSLEMALAHEAVANDAAQPPEARRVASEVATGWRERARRFQLQAQRQATDPIVPDVRSIHPPAPAYTGPERREKTRRTQTRRGPAASYGVDRFDRRSGPDRRQRDRRRPELASR
jgi:hypothetical protein